MKRTLLRTLVIGIIAVCSALKMNAATDFDYGDFSFNIVDATKLTAEVAGYYGSATEVTIPAQVTAAYNKKKYNVVGIGSKAFYNNKSIKKVTIPATVSYIETFAFCYCSALKSIDLPAGVTKVASYAFASCTSLASASLGATTSLGQKAFNKCTALTSMTLPSTLTSIGAEAFSGCTSLTSINIPAGLKTLYSDTFTGCTKLKTLKYQAEDCNVQANTFNGLAAFSVLTFSEGVLHIPASAFENCKNLSSISVAHSVKTIGNNAFKNCANISSLTLGTNLASIGDQAFYGCEKFETLIIPSLVSSIGAEAFAYCKGLKKASINSTPSLTVSKYAFADCTALTTMAMGGKVTTLSEGVFMNTALETLTIPAATQSIDPTILLGNTTLKTLKVADGNPYFDSRNNCNAIINKDSNTLIVGLAISTIPNTVAAIGTDAFNSAIGLKKVELPNSVQKINTRAFYNCKDLLEVSFENSLYRIGDQAFYFCTNLNRIRANAVTPPTCAGEKVFSDIYKTCDIYVTADSYSSYRTAYIWKNFTRIVPLTGIENAEAAAAEAQRFDAAGRTLTAPAKGINIIKMSDGTIRKVLVR